MAHYTIDGKYVDNIEHFGSVDNLIGGKVPAPKAGGIAMGAIDNLGSGAVVKATPAPTLPGSISFGKSVSSSIVDKSCPTCPPEKICPTCPTEKICPTCPTCPPEKICPTEKTSCIIS